MVRSFILTMSVLAIVLAFQNCSQSDNVHFSEVTASKMSNQDTDNGIPYDGKIFILMGGVCPDGTRIESRIVLRSATSGELVRKDCADIQPTLLGSNDFVFDPSNPNQLTYQGKIFSVWSPSEVGAGYGELPKLTNPVDPTSHGAKGDGVTDNTNAFIAALSAGDMLIPPGTYLVNGTIRVPPGRNIQCADPATVKIINPIRSTGGNHTFQFWGNGGSLSNCSLSGAGQLNPNGSANFNVSMQFNFLVSVVDYWGPVSNVKIIKNIFENCHGNACVTLYGGSGGGVVNNKIAYNTFRNCGYYGVVVEAGTDNVISYNHSTDCAIGIQNTNTNQPNANNILESNYLTISNGNGRLVLLGGNSSEHVFLSGGTASSGVNYSSNVVRYNTVVGNGQPDSIGIRIQTAIPAQYKDNVCKNGCSQF